MYLTYTEYQAYGGTLDTVKFAEFEFEARKVVDYYTFDRLRNDTTISEAVKRLMYKLITSAQTITATLTASGDSAAIVRQSNDGVSVQYNAMKAFDLYGVLKTSEGDTIRQYLSGEKNQAGKVLLYRGL